MRLLSKQEIKADSMARHELEVRRQIKLSQIAEKEIKRINELGGQVDNEKRKVAQDFDRFCDSINQKKFKLDKELHVLEKQLGEGMKPLEEFEKQLYIKEDKVKEMEEVATAKRKELESLAREINESQVFVAKKTKELVDEELRIGELSVETNVGWSKYHKAKREQEKKFNKRELKLADLEQKAKIQAKKGLEEANANKAVHLSLMEDKTRQEAEWVRIRDERKTLERAKKEILNR